MFFLKSEPVPPFCALIWLGASHAITATSSDAISRPPTEIFFTVGYHIEAIRY